MKILKAHILLFWFCIFIVRPNISLAQSTMGDGIFNFDQVRAALEYFEAPNQRNLTNVAFTVGAEQLTRHALMTGAFPSGSSAFDISKTILANRPDSNFVTDIATRMTRIKSDHQKQSWCTASAQEFLPAATANKNPLFITWGYPATPETASAAINGAAVINIAHPRYLATLDLFWLDCVKAMHSAGITGLNPVPFTMREVHSTTAATAIIEYWTFIEGSSLYATSKSIEGHGLEVSLHALTLLSDKANLGRLEARYNDIVNGFRERDRAMLADDWARFEELYAGDHLWMMVGAHMAETIDQQLGRQSLKDAAANGPGRFFELYQQAKAQMD